MAFVLDASATLPWCFKDEENALTEALLRRAEAGEQIFVPSHWPAEVLQGATRAMRRGRLMEADAAEFLLKVPAFNIAIDRRSIADQWLGARDLIERHRLSAYDASYLALALFLTLPLATFDGQLRTTAEIEGVSLVA